MYTCLQHLHLLPGHPLDEFCFEGLQAAPPYSNNGERRTPRSPLAKRWPCSLFRFSMDGILEEQATNSVIRWGCKNIDSLLAGQDKTFVRMSGLRISTGESFVSGSLVICPTTRIAWGVPRECQPNPIPENQKAMTTGSAHCLDLLKRSMMKTI